MCKYIYIESEEVAQDIIKVICFYTITIIKCFYFKFYLFLRCGKLSKPQQKMLLYKIV